MRCGFSLLREVGLSEGQSKYEFYLALFEYHGVVRFVPKAQWDTCSVSTMINKLTLPFERRENLVSSSPMRDNLLSVECKIELSDRDYER